MILDNPVDQSEFASRWTQQRREFHSGIHAFVPTSLNRLLNDAAGDSAPRVTGWVSYVIICFLMNDESGAICFKQ